MKIACLVSGGVDSSVALKLLKDQGHDVTAFYLKIWLEDELSFLGDCPWEEDLDFVEKVCEQVGVPLEVISLQREYLDRVVSYHIDEVAKGRTPNPDMMCNQRVKFGAFFERIDDSFEKVATGHYAQVEEQDGQFFLKKAPDPIKDQSYFLAAMSQEQLARAMFPIGHLQKPEVRELADKFNLVNKDRKDSQGICFLGKIQYNEFLKQHLGEKPGDILEFETGEKLGGHKGFYFHTVGQRKGLGLSGGPWYVVGKDTDKNIVYVSREYESDEKERNEFEVGEFNWFNTAPESKELQVKVRHGESFYNCTLDFNDDGSKAMVHIDGRDQGLAAGQFAVFYDGEICLGSGVIQ